VARVAGVARGQFIFGQPAFVVLRPFHRQPCDAVEFLRADAFTEFLRNCFSLNRATIQLNQNAKCLMNESNPNPSSCRRRQIPTGAPPSSYPPRVALGEIPEERQAIGSLAAAIESILRQPRRVMFQLRQPGRRKLIAAMLFIAVACSLIYGVIVGSFSGGVQWWAAPLKISAGLLISALICLPSLYIFACLSGSQHGWWKSSAWSRGC